MFMKSAPFQQPFSSLVDFFETSFRKYGSLTALENHGTQLTYAELDRLSKAFAVYLQQQGLKKGDRIALQLPNVLTYPVAMIGALRAGLTIVNTNPLYTTAEMRHQLKDAGVKAVVILANFAHRLVPIVDELGLKKVVIVQLGDLLGTVKGGLLNLAVKYVKRMVPAYDLPQADAFMAALAAGEGGGWEAPKLKKKDIALLQYTGGTTGTPKGAVLTHDNLLSNLAQMLKWQGGLLQERVECVITPLPLYHIFSFTANLLIPTALGAHNVLVTNPRDLKGLVKVLRRHPFSLVTGVNTLFKALLQTPGFDKVSFASSKAIIGGGMAVSRVVARQWKKQTGVYVVEGYGLTEASPVVATNLFEKQTLGEGVGFPLPGTQVKVVDEAGKTVHKGETGEVWIKGPQVMQGYWQQPEATREVMHRGWLKTGDIAFIAKSGALHLVDRKKELINVSGFNVYPSEIEGAAMTHPAVQDAGVVGVPDERTGEAIKLCVVLEKGAKLTAADVRQHCRQTLTGYKVPKHIVFLASLPKSTVGKVLRRALKDIEG